MCDVDLPRTYELMASLSGAAQSYFTNFKASIRDNPIKRKYFVDIEADLATLDAVAWDHLKSKVGPLFLKREKARGWQGAFNELNEAKAYNWLIGRGCSSVAFIPRDKTKTPDLRAKLHSADILCEVKTVSRSEQERLAQQQSLPRSISNYLQPEFFKKLVATVGQADRQMTAFSTALNVNRIVYIVINFDDLLHEYVDDYLVQIQEHREEFLVSGLEIVMDVKPKFYAATSNSEASLLLNFTAQGSWLPPLA